MLIGHNISILGNNDAGATADHQRVHLSVGVDLHDAGAHRLGNTLYGISARIVLIILRYIRLFLGSDADMNSARVGLHRPMGQIPHHTVHGKAQDQHKAHNGGDQHGTVDPCRRRLCRRRLRSEPGRRAVVTLGIALLPVGLLILVGTLISLPIGLLILIGTLVPLPIGLLILVGTLIPLPVGLLILVGTLISLPIGLLILVGTLISLPIGLLILIGTLISLPIGLLISGLTVGTGLVLCRCPGSGRLLRRGCLRLAAAVFVLVFFHVPNPFVPWGAAAFSPSRAA